MNENQVDEYFGRANVLLGAGRFEEAVDLLRAARESASLDGDHETEAFFSSIAGSFLASRARNQEALEEYARAELRDPFSPAWKVSTANHLLNLGEPAKAREKAQEVLACGAGTPSYEHVGYSLLGLAELGLSNQEAAASAFAASIEPFRVSDLPASGRDVRLAEALLKAGLSARSCRNYLSEVRTRAQVEGDTAVDRRVREIENRFLSREPPA